MARTISTNDLAQERAARAAERAEMNTDDNPVWIFPDELEIVVQFLVDPTDPTTVKQYREAYCPEFRHVQGSWGAGPYAGKPRAEIPFGLRDVVCEDWEPFVTNEGTVRVRYLNRDVVEILGQPMDILSDVLDGSSVRFGVDDNGNIRPGWKVLVDAVVWGWPTTKNSQGNDKRHPQPGDHVLLKFREVDWRERIMPALSARAEEGVDVTAVKWAIKLAKADKKTNTSRMAKLLHRGAADPITDIELYDVDEILDEQRGAFLRLAELAFADYTGVDITPSATPEDDDVPEWATPTESGVNYDLISTPELRNRLKAAGVEFDGRWARPKLIALAREHGA